MTDSPDKQPVETAESTAAEIQDPPRGFIKTIKQLGPGLIIAGSIVGSGELIATTKTGAEAGITLLWLILLGCVIKIFVQIELGRYAITHRETTLTALDRVPGPRLKANWIIWCWLAMMVTGVAQLGGIVGGVGQALAISFPITGDFAEAIKMPSLNQLKKYDEYKDDVLSEWDLMVYLNPTEIHGSTAPADDSLQVESEYYFNPFLAMYRAHLVKEKSVAATEPTLESLSQKQGLAHKDLIETATRLSTLRIEYQDTGTTTDDYHATRERLRSQLIDLNLQFISAREPQSPPINQKAVRSHLLIAEQLVDVGLQKSAEAIAAAESWQLQVEFKKISDRVDRLDEKEGRSVPHLERQAFVERINASLDYNKRIAESYINPPTRDDKYWAAVIAVLTSLLLYRGRYQLIQNLSMILVVTFTFITVGNVVSLQSTTQFHTSADQILHGLAFRLPEKIGEINPLLTALATFGIIGVGATELITYPYWCLEKGYGKHTGPREDTESWAIRARGWMRVMHIDAVLSMVVFTIATLAFFIMGVAVLHNEGRDPDGMRMVSTLATAYVPVFGVYAKWLFLFGAIAVLYSTFLVANAGHSRMWTDGLKVFGLLDRDNEAAHHKTLTTICVCLPFVCLAVYCSGVNPVTAIVIAGLAQALLLPMIGFGAIYFRMKHTDERLRPSRVWDVALVISIIGLLIAGVWGGYSAIAKMF